MIPPPTELPLRNPDVATALATWFDAVARAGGMRPLGVETVDLAAAAGRVTARAIVATRSSPAFDAAAMDGIAVLATATSGAPATLPADAFAPIDTGDPLPPRTDAVVRRENVVLGAGAAIEAAVSPYDNVRQVGEDIAAGDLVLPPGRLLQPADLAVVASAGESTVSVRRRPIVSILPSGDELVPVGADLRPGQIRETNSLMLGAMVDRADGVALRQPILPDDPDLLAAALAPAADAADLVLLVAGSAKGADDHTISVIERLGQTVVQGVAVRPGHPVVLGLVGSTPVIGVPGYPVSAALAFELFAAPLLAALSGAPAPERPRVRATARAEIRSASRSDEWIRVRVGRVGGDLVAIPLRRGAGILSSLADADGLVLVPSGSSGVQVGDELEVELLRSLTAIEATLLVTGSTDPLLDRIAAHLCVESTQAPAYELRFDPSGSASGAAALEAGQCHLALVVSGDVPTGAIEIAAWERELGLIVARDNPLGVAEIDDLRRPDVRFTNRPQGSSTRRILDALLAERGIDPQAVAGYGREARSHAAAAAAVASGAADCALAVSSACAASTLGFVPLVAQTIVLVAAPGLEHEDRITDLRARLRAGAPRDEIDAVGYRSVPL